MLSVNWGQLVEMRKFRSFKQGITQYVENSEERRLIIRWTALHVVHEMAYAMSEKAEALADKMV